MKHLTKRRFLSSLGALISASLLPFGLVSLRGLKEEKWVIYSFDGRCVYVLESTAEGLNGGENTNWKNISPENINSIAFKTKDYQGEWS